MRHGYTRAAVLPHARGAVTIESREIGEAGPGEALLRMEACGVCHSDLHVAGLEKLPVAPVTLGHEGIGRIESLGEGVTGWKTGDRAGVTFLATTCGACEWCSSGRERFCPKQTNFGFTKDGALSEYAVLPAAALVRAPEDMSAVDIAPFCCAGWTAAGAIREAGLASGHKIALFGYGGLGHLALQMARNRGLRVAVADVSEEKLEMARASGAEMALASDAAGRAIQKDWGGADAAIVFTGSAAAAPAAFRSLKRTGTLLLVGVSMSQYELSIVDTVVKGISVRGSYLGTRQDLEDAFAMARAGQVRAHVHTHALAETPAILERMRQGRISGRAVIRF